MVSKSLGDCSRPYPPSLVCKAVDIWGLEMLLPIATEHPASEIVCEDENDIRGNCISHIIHPNFLRQRQDQEY